MSNQVFDQLEKKIKEALEAIELMQMEIDELKDVNNKLLKEKSEIEEKFNTLQNDHSSFQARLQNLLSQIDLPNSQQS